MVCTLTFKVKVLRYCPFFLNGKKISQKKAVAYSQALAITNLPGYTLKGSTLTFLFKFPALESPCDTVFQTSFCSREWHVSLIIIFDSVIKSNDNKNPLSTIFQDADNIMTSRALHLMNSGKIRNHHG